MRDIIYIHGFASSGNGWKAKQVKEKFKDYNVYTPDLSHNPELAINQIVELINNTKNPIIVGSSLGGFYADYFNLKYDLPSILINPVVDTDIFRFAIGEQKNYVTGEKFLFKNEYYDYLNQLKSEKLNNSKYKNRIGKQIILVAKDDKLIPPKITIEEFINNNQDLRIFQNGGHGFENVEAIFSSINDLI